MAVTGIQDWVFWATGGALALVGVILGAWALVWDRARGRKRCPKCWYDMSAAVAVHQDGLEVFVCPECGTHARTAKELARTRHRLPWLGVTVVLLALAHVTGRIPAWQAHGWTGLIPTTALVLFAPVSETVRPVPFISRLSPPPTPVVAPNLPLSAELSQAAWTRLFGDEMMRWQSQIFIGRFLRASGRSLGSRVRVPERWLCEQPIPVLVDNSGSIPANISVTDATGHVSTPSGGNLAMLSPLKKGPLPLHLELDGSQGALYACDVSMPIHLTPGKADLLVVENSQTANRHVRDALDLRLVRCFGTLKLLAEDRSNEMRWQRAPFGLAYKVEIVSDGQVIGTVGCATSRSGPLPWRNWWTLTIHWKPGAEELVLEHVERARLVVRGDPEETVRSYLEDPFAGPTSVAWAGTFEIPATIDQPASPSGQ